MLWNSGEWIRLLKSASEAAKWMDMRPESEAMAVSFRACFSTSEALILRTSTAADSSEEMVAAAKVPPALVAVQRGPCETCRAFDNERPLLADE